jgi:hypothetical protein
MQRRRKFISRQMCGKRARARLVRQFSWRVSLVNAAATRRISATPGNHHPTRIVTAAVHRFEESIAGRAYLIEVAEVTNDRWRAYIVRVPGVPTALMPFYGATPAEAAGQLCQWLTRAHARAATPSS